jgi:plasmid stabilization system protein ParE
MKFTVVYLPSAEDQLAELWLSAEDRDAVREAADEIDRLLGQHPQDVGEARVSNLRILVRQPIAVLYDVRPDDQLVKVWAAWQWTSRR